VITAASKEAIELLTLMLHYDPNRRISASDALKHK
jgi:serine/threonine protein kinase